MINQQFLLTSSIEGFLMKKSPKFLVGWQKRYCIVKDMKFYYYKKKGDQNFKGCVDFMLTTVEIQEKEKGTKNEAFILSIKGLKRNFEFRLDNQEQGNIESWKHVIKTNIDRANVYKKNILFNEKDLYSQKEFWRSDRISLSKFEKDADTGDILLFKGKSAMCKLQRVLTLDQYDHVAILLRFEDGQLYMLEALSQEGVSLCNWNKFLRNGWHNAYSKLVFRHLEIERSDEFINKLDEFQQHARGKKYSISTSKIWKHWSRRVDDPKKDESKTYFCSELVAAAYKQLGLLSEEISAASYWPGSFSTTTEKGLQLMTGKLENELLIDFGIFERFDNKLRSNNTV